MTTLHVLVPRPHRSPRVGVVPLSCSRLLRPTSAPGAELVGLVRDALRRRDPCTIVMAVMAAGGEHVALLAARPIGSRPRESALPFALLALSAVDQGVNGGPS
jgi:hypothetical protein